MFEKLQYFWKIQNLRKSFMNLNKLYKKDVEKAYHQKLPESKIQDIRGMWEHEVDMLGDEMEAVITEELMRQLALCWESIPRKDGIWRKSRHYGYLLLTKEGMKEAHKLLANARQVKRENWGYYIKMTSTIVGALTGMIGAITGMLAVIGN